LNFIAIDLNTADLENKKLSSIGIAVVEAGVIVSTREYLISSKESFGESNIFVVDFKAENVKDSYEFPVVWNEIKPMLENNVVIAFNANLKMSLLMNTLDKYEIQHPSIKFSCSRFIAKKIWRKLSNYRLSAIADNLNIGFKEDSTKESAIVYSKVFLEALREVKVSSIEELHNILELQLGYMDKDSCSTVGRKLGNKDIQNKTAGFPKCHGLINKNVVFTGTLESMVRREAMGKVIKIGGFCSSVVNQNTNILVVGVQSRAKLRGKSKSSKMLRAERLIKEGKDILIITEDEFLNMF